MTKFCGNCGAQLDDSARVCERCGMPQQVNAVQQQVNPVQGLDWTGAQKAAWFFIGMLGGIAGILMVSMSNIGHPNRSTATKMAIIGCASLVIVYLLIVLITGCSTAMMVSQIGGRRY